MKNKINLLKFKVVSVLLVLLSIALTQCEPPKEESDADKFEKDLKNFNQKMGNIGQSIEMLDAMQNELDKIEQLRASGEIDDAEFSKRANEIKETYGRAIAKRDKLKPATGLPVWAQELGLTEPIGMVIDQGFSQITSVENGDEGFNSVLMVYNGDYNVAMKEADRIARIARIPVSKDYVQAMEIVNTYGSSPIKGISYMNFDPFVKDAPINISITVDENGVLTISAVDVEQMKRQFNTGRTTTEE